MPDLPTNPANSTLLPKNRQCKLLENVTAITTDVEQPLRETQRQFTIGHTDIKSLPCPSPPTAAATGRTPPRFPCTQDTPCSIAAAIGQRPHQHKLSLTTRLPAVLLSSVKLATALSNSFPISSEASISSSSSSSSSSYSISRMHP